MALVQEYAILNQEFSNAQNLLNTREETYRIHTEETVPAAEHEVIVADEIKELIQRHNVDLLAALIGRPDYDSSSLVQHTYLNVLGLDDTHELITPAASLITTNANTSLMLSQFAEARESFEAVEHLTAEAIITQEGLEEVLYATGNVIPDSVEIQDGTDISGASNAYISWGITGVILTPNENPYSWINEGGSVEIALADVKVEINLHTNQVYLKAFGENNLANLPYKYSSEMHVHPHVLGHHKPCLGDWSGPVTEAICEQDWGTVSGMLSTYLSNANTNDIAGKNWYAGVVIGHYRLGEYSKNSEKFKPYTDLPFDATHAKFNTDPENPGKFTRTFFNAQNQIVDPDNPPHEYEIGDTVKLNEGSIHYNPRRTTGTNPANTEGRFMEYVSENGRQRLRVKWPDGINSYDRSDLEWVEEPEHILPEIITDLPQSNIQFPVGQHEDAMDVARYSDMSIAGRSGFDIVTDIESEVTGRIPGTPSLFD